MMDYFFFFCGLIILLSGANYYFQIGGYKKGWESLKEEFDGENTQTKFSIIIPARNEKANILNCLNSIKNLDYPKENFEVIVVDDSSEDETAALVESFIAANPQVQIRLLKLGEVITSPINSYKKTAIAEAIKITKNDWLLTTDADCTYYPKWLKSFSSFIQKEKPVMVTAPVVFTTDNSFYDNAQHLEFAGLIAIGAASLANQKPTMCNGANLCYKKSVFIAVNGFEGNHHLASGDDEFLMHKVSEKYPKQVMFLKNKNVMTHTLPAGDIGRFLAQRKRWVSKSKHYENSGITRDLTIAWVYNFMIVLSFVLGFFDVKYFLVFALGLSIKVMAEIPFFASISNFLELKNWRRIYPAATLVHSIYVVFIGIYGNFGGYRWKGRTVK